MLSDFASLLTAAVPLLIAVALLVFAVAVFDMSLLGTGTVVLCCIAAAAVFAAIIVKRAD